MKNLSKERIMIANSLVRIARTVMSEEDNEADDPKLAEKIRNLRSGLNGLKSKGKKKLKSMGIENNIMVSQATVEDLIDMLTTITAK